MKSSSNSSPRMLLTGYRQRLSTCPMRLIGQSRKGEAGSRKEKQFRRSALRGLFFHVSAVVLLVVPRNLLVKLLVQFGLRAFGENAAGSDEGLIHPTWHDEEFVLHQTFVPGLGDVLGRRCVLECARFHHSSFREEVGVGRARAERSHTDAGVFELDFERFAPGKNE